MSQTKTALAVVACLLVAACSAVPVVAAAPAETIPPLNIERPADVAMFDGYDERIEKEQAAHDASVKKYLEDVHAEKVRLAAAARAARSARGRSVVTPSHELAKASSPRSAPEPGSAREIGQRLAADRGWDGAQWDCLNTLWTNENSWRTDRGGIPQAKPMSKMASAGPEWRTDAATQIRWGLGYIAARYGDPCSALSFWRCKGICMGIRKDTTWY